MQVDTKSKFVGFLLFLSCTAVSATLPDWVKQAAAQPVGAFSPDTNAVVLLDDTDYTVNNPQEYVEHRRRVVKIFRPDGRDEGEVGVAFRGGEKVLSIHGWSIDKTAHEYEMKDREFSEGSNYSFELYSDYRFRAGMLPASTSGSVVAFEYELRRSAIFNQLHWTPQETQNPVQEAHLTVTLPIGWEYKASWGNIPAVDPIRGNGQNTWRWTVQDRPRIADEKQMPSFLALTGRMVLTYFPPEGRAGNLGSWSGMAKWYGDLAADRRVSTPAITETVNRLVAGQSSFDGKLRTLASFLQSEIRYVAIEIGIGGFRPHAAEEVFRLRYGDCKDKATLLSVMLAQAGIHSNYLVIHTQRGIALPSIPSVYSFNHVVLAIDLPDDVRSDAYQSVFTATSGKHYLLFDPTDEFTPVGELRSELQNTYALLVTNSGGELIRTPAQTPNVSQLVRKGVFTLSPDGTLSGEVLEDRSGDLAWEYRVSMRWATKLERKRHIENFLNRSLKGFALHEPELQQLDKIDKDLLVRYKFSTPQYAQAAGSMMLVRPRVLGEKSFAVATKPRLYPYELQGLSRQIDSYEIEVPPDYKVDDLPEGVKIDVGFASYQSKIEVVGSKIEYSRELVVRDFSVPPERIADLRKFEGVIGGDETATVVLKRVQ